MTAASDGRVDSGGKVLTSIEPLGNRASDGIAARFAARPIFCSPARYEPFGLGVLEAAQAGDLRLSDALVRIAGPVAWQDGAASLNLLRA